jgi:hypothetical protein
VLLLFVAFHPGLMSYDSLEQYRRGLLGAYRNEHPPLVCWLFGLCAKVLKSPWPILLGQLSLLAGGLWSLACSASARFTLAAALVAVVGLVLPSTWAVGVVLWKDVLMASAFLVAVKLFLERRPALALGTMALATAIRHNAIVAAIPLLWFAVWQIAPRWSRALRGAVCLLLFAFGLVGIPKAIDRVFRGQDIWMLGQIVTHDLAGLYASHPTDWDGSPFASETTIPGLARAYDPSCVVPLFYGPHWAIAMDSLSDRKGPILREWFRVVGRHPATYLGHRWTAFVELLGMHATVCYPFHTGIDANPYGLRLADYTWVHRTLRHIADASRNAPFFRGWIWLLLCGALLVVALVSRRKLAAATAASGLIYGLAYFFVGACCDFRYLYWTSLAAIAAALLMFAREPDPIVSEPRGAQATAS